jgi:hypothetical protein
LIDDLFDTPNDVDFVQMLLADLHDDLVGRVARFKQLSDLSHALGKSGTMLPGGETTHNAWLEARSSFVYGNYIATVMLCQGLAEHLLAAHLELGLDDQRLPAKVQFVQTLDTCIERKVINENDASDLKKLMSLRNPLSHYRNLDDPHNLTRRALSDRVGAGAILFNDATFSIGLAIRLLSNRHFRLDG